MLKNASGVIDVSLVFITVLSEVTTENGQLAGCAVTRLDNKTVCYSQVPEVHVVPQTAVADV